MLFEDFTCPRCRLNATPDPTDETVWNVNRDSMRGARFTTEIAQLHRCKEGHDFLVHLQDGGHALLYERALQRLVDGRTRDAVLDAYTALDMFLSSFVLRIAFEARYPPPIPLDAAPLEPLRKELGAVLKLSERTLGAALALACVESGKAPPVLDTKLNRLRNDAAHAGAYPSDEEAEWACLHVEELVHSFRACVPLEPGKDAPLDRFRMALFLESKRRALGDAPAPIIVTRSFLAVLDESRPPGRRTAAGRIAEYRQWDRVRIE